MSDRMLTECNLGPLPTSDVGSGHRPESNANTDPQAESGELPEHPESTLV